MRREWNLNSRTKLIEYAEKNQLVIPQDKIGEPPFSVDENILHTFIDSGHSKLPVYKDNIDNIIGLIYLYDLFKNPDNLEVKLPEGTLGARGTEFVVLSEKNKKSTIVLLGPGPNNSLGMIPGSLQISDGNNMVSITNPGYQAMI